ncbi:uncharacterized protein [Spinacia oleracea]|uniref:DUF4218 domain-containing protein n=1 Tax=Spinacia oleracea TaxID=3562 RepID=A0ABM3QXJ6_SPIOL|nr:uncharacterized protein LOC110798445 [Spinacia oleracea]
MDMEESVNLKDISHAPPKNTVTTSLQRKFTKNTVTDIFTKNLGCLVGYAVGLLVNTLNYYLEEMDNGTKEWWMAAKWSEEYERGINEYIKRAFYIKEIPTLDADELSNQDDLDDDLVGLLHDARDAFREGPNDEAKKFFQLLEGDQEELYPGCKTHSKLSFMIRLLIIKCDHKLTNGAYADIADLVRKAFPDAKLPKSFNEANSALKVLGLNYTKIDACPNDCMLYWEEHANSTSCHVCDTPRWKSNDTENDTPLENGKVHRIPKKILRYFPIKRRLQRLFMCQETASNMPWHTSGRENDHHLHHPVDGKAWKEFDSLYPKFSEDPRNVRLGLATDGFSPFNSMSIAHSTWPVILINYNLPPWMIMKPEFLMIALLIPGPSSPGNDIDIYLQPLIKDLKELWEFGLETYDSSSNQRFDMRAALMTTVSDFPAYAMLSGWSTKGYFACPDCHYDTDSERLDFSKKNCYRATRRFLDPAHPWRYNKRNFDGVIEERSEPIPLKGADVEYMLRDFPNEFGKKQKKTRGDEDDPVPWRKISILFQLPYWKHCSNRHNLDVMHIEKNVFDNVLGTLLDIPGKTRDHESARRDLVKMNIMPELQPKLVDGREVFPRSHFWMSLEQKRKFCRVIKNAKLPQGYASNISRCVQVEDRKITGYKSHDAHFMMNYLLPIAVKTTLPKDVATLLIRLCGFFKGIWSKTIDPQHLDRLHSEIVEALCMLERIFPPAFFDIMVHLPVHLVKQIKLGGPVSSNCMYGIERYLHELKFDVRNKGRSEGSMAEGYQAKECIAFIARHLKRSNISTHDVNECTVSQSFLPKIGRPIEGKGRTSKKKHCGHMIDRMTWAQAHRYVLFNCDCEDVERYINEHKMCVSSKRKRKWNSAQDHNKDFIDWFREKVELEVEEGQEIISDHLIWLSKGPSYVAKKHTCYSFNGYRFHTMKRDAKCVTQNSGVTLTAITHSFASSKDQNPVVGDVNYYGSIQD